MCKKGLSQLPGLSVGSLEPGLASISPAFLPGPEPVSKELVGDVKGGMDPGEREEACAMSLEEGGRRKCCTGLGRVLAGRGQCSLWVLTHGCSLVVGEGSQATLALSNLPPATTHQTHTHTHTHTHAWHEPSRVEACPVISGRDFVWKEHF
jgi:hypothetical protein